MTRVRFVAGTPRPSCKKDTTYLFTLFVHLAFIVCSNTFKNGSNVFCVIVSWIVRLEEKCFIQKQSSGDSL